MSPLKTKLIKAGLCLLILSWPFVVAFYGPQIRTAILSLAR